MRKFWACTLILFYQACVFAQSDSLLILARQHREKKEYSSAFKYYYQNNALLEKGKNNEKLVLGYSETARLFEEWQIYSKAAEYYKKVLEIYEQDKPANWEIKEDFFNKKIAKNYENDKKYKEATFYYEKVLESLRRKKNTVAEALILANLANLYNLQNEYEKALNCNFQALAIYQNIQNIEAQATTLNNIGFGYQKLKNLEKAFEFFEKSKLQYEKTTLKHTPEYRTALVNLGILYQGKNEFSKAKESLLLAEQSLQKYKNIDESEAADIYDLIAKTLFYSNEIDKSEKYSYQGLEYAKKSANLQAQQSIYETLSLIFSARNQNKAALEAYQKHKSLSDSIFRARLAYQDDLLKRKLISDELENELRVLQAEQDLKKLDLKNYQLEAEKKEKEFEIERQQKAIRLVELEQNRLREQARISSLLIEKQRQEAQMQDQALKLVQQANLLKEAELKNAKIREQVQEEERKRREELLLKDQKLKEKELEQTRLAQRNQRNLFLLIASSGTGFLLVFMWAFYRKQKDNKKLKAQKQIIIEKNSELNAANEELTSAIETISLQKEDIERKNLEILEKNDELNAANEELISAVETISTQKEELEQKNQSIIDSINYAQRIQSAFLPQQDVFEKTFPDSFILYLPKDIVSGDFYWLYEVEDYIILAVMDCTGHGVPGAFMSMIGASFLDKIVKEYGIYMPNEILMVLDNFITNAIKKEGERLMDGMDGVIITIDKRNQELHFAGAKSSMYLLQNSDEMQIIEGDNMHIAGYNFDDIPPLKEFNRQTFKIQKPFVVYLGSDGYQDQMGGEKGKKFMVRKLRNLLQEIAYLPPKEQRDILLQNFETWKGNHPQTDDVLVIGLKWV
jgi:serine phosphatase RsbU (regulator of sigma subunit)/tetratricopeptide (TPR) repeat protein